MYIQLAYKEKQNSLGHTSVNNVNHIQNIVTYGLTSGFVIQAVAMAAILSWQLCTPKEQALIVMTLVFLKNQINQADTALQNIIHMLCQLKICKECYFHKKDKYMYS